MSDQHSSGGKIFMTVSDSNASLKFVVCHSQKWHT